MQAGPSHGPALRKRLGLGATFSGVYLRRAGASDTFVRPKRVILRPAERLIGWVRSLAGHIVVDASLREDLGHGW